MCEHQSIRWIWMKDNHESGSCWGSLCSGSLRTVGGRCILAFFVVAFCVFAVFVYSKRQIRKFKRRQKRPHGLVPSHISSHVHILLWTAEITADICGCVFCSIEKHPEKYWMVQSIFTYSLPVFCYFLLDLFTCFHRCTWNSLWFGAMLKGTCATPVVCCLKSYHCMWCVCVCVCVCVRRTNWIQSQAEFTLHHCAHLWIT